MLQTVSAKNKRERGTLKHRAWGGNVGSGDGGLETRASPEKKGRVRRRQPSAFWKRCFLKTSVSNGIIYTKYTQNPHIIEPPFNIATQSATYTVTACVSRWEPNVLNANNPCPAARQKQYWYFISLLRFSALKCKPNGQKNVVVLENLIIESLDMIETEL